MMAVEVRCHRPLQVVPGAKDHRWWPAMHGEMQCRLRGSPSALNLRLP